MQIPGPSQLPPVQGGHEMKLMLPWTHRRTPPRRRLKPLPPGSCEPGWQVLVLRSPASGSRIRFRV